MLSFAMGEDFDPSADASTTITNRRILTTMAILVGIGTFAGCAIGGPPFGTGVLLGGGIGALNYLWLDAATKALFREDAIYSTSILAMKYVFRYVVIGAILLGIFLTSAVPVAAVILGLGAFAFAVVIQGFRSIFTRSTE